MVTKYFIGTVCCTLIMISLAGCEKFLSVKSDAKLLIPKTIPDLQGMLDDVTLMNIARTPSYGEASSDDVYYPPSQIDGGSEIARNVYSWKKFDYQYPNEWATAYLPIYNSNFCLEGISAIERLGTNAAGWDNVKGSALFFRSFYFFLLTTQFGLGYGNGTSDQDLGIVLRLSSDFNVPSKRSTVKECLLQALSDAKGAAELLPNDPLVKFRPSKAAAYAQLARIYLYMHDYTNALYYADQCLRIKATLMDYNGDSDVVGLDLAIPFKRFNKETIFHAEMFAGFSVHIPVNAKIDPLLYSSYEPDDLRKRAFFRANTGFQQFKGSYAGTANLFSGIAVDEIYLIRAECRARLGDMDGGMDDLNALLIKRWKNTVIYIPRTAQGQNDAISQILMERRKELLMRGLRWSDIKRYNKEGAGIRLRRVLTGITFYLEPNAPFYALPLPNDIIEIAELKQN
ncbi:MULTISPECIES: RagB/SusD family nutrient uptake outer membrane protein [unclassified Pedobacter]|uniref:RagB/SusD family nutrient uptake outer membrane protein n=1 Tax=unclassified Pedobacter TaxID=2628915 RepID=UPI001D53BDA5|nr:MULTISPECIES: RagB/SusD family nutrient uptake outer membrane protein [unclassified Pedobacter]CAH0266796.1 hypothetical protein SRABI36_03620 [Pedobacter sp. Bi36]CAH0293065.1 hypothetical protein SRABI126_04114 [Pedobacter sp. Bi126]